MKQYGSIIVGEHYTKEVGVTRRLRKKNAEIVRKAEAWRKQPGLNSPPLLIRMNETANDIPAGIPIEVPYELSTSLIRVRVSTPVGDFKVVPSLVVSEGEL
jgi:hypothetical protein